jgi:hypothetical protein
MQTKEKLVRLETQRLSNEMFFRFMTENKVYYVKYDPATLEIAGLMPEYDAALDDLDTALERIRKSSETDRIAVLDAEFDTSYSGMEGYVRVCLKHFSPDVRHAAENLVIVFDKYGNIGRQPYRQELGSSVNLLEDLQARAADVDAIQLRPWMEAHEAAANALAALLDIRTGEDAQQTDIRVIDARRRMENIYQKTTNRLDAVINLRGKDFAGGFYAEYNAHATEYKNTLAQHLGRIRKTNGELRMENDEYNNYIEYGDTARIPYRRGVPRLYNGGTR